MTFSKDSDKITLFLDTSIPVSQIIKGDDFRKRIDYLLPQFRWLGISSYSQLEYGNRVLDECEYLIGQLREKCSFARTKDWITNGLPQQWRRKQIITLNLLNKIYGNNDQECMERALYELTDLMESGVEEQRFETRPLSIDKSLHKLLEFSQKYYIIHVKGNKAM